MNKLNRVQRKLYKNALFIRKDFLLCAPTSDEKTNVSMLTILQQIIVDLSKSNIVYVAPMKASVAKMVGNLSN